LNTEEILSLYELDSTVIEIITSIEEGKKHIYIDGLKGSSKNLIAATIFKKINRTVVFIAKGQEEANYSLNDVESFIDDKNLSFYIIFFINIKLY
jgi:excinuclease UvrABC helicase subunit UvrB